MGETASLRSAYPAVSPRAARKVLSELDEHMRRFIALSPFLCLGSASASGTDVTPRGDSAGFVHVVDSSTLLIPDWPGNNRLDSLTNVECNPEIGILFMIPGVNETLRVNGTATITFDAKVLETWNVNGKHPRSALAVTVRECFLHCGKALIRAHLWEPTARVERGALPSLGQMLKDQTRLDDTAEQIEQSLQEGYKTRLY